MSLWTQLSAPVPLDTAEPPRRAEVVIAGAGLTGLSLARMLTLRGIDVVVVEARSIGAVTSGRATGDLSLLQGDVFQRIREHAGPSVVRAYADANRAAQAWMRDELADAPDGTIVETDAVTFATTDEGAARIGEERSAMAGTGIDVELLAGADDLGLPFATTAGLRLRGQSQLQPMNVLGHLAATARGHGARVVEGCRVTGASNDDDTVIVETTKGDITCAHLVLATGTPILDRGASFARLVASRSFVSAYGLPDDAALPRGMFLSVDEPAHSLRVDRAEGGSPILIVGGGSHPTGPSDRTSAMLSELDSWTHAHWPDAVRRTWWAAQDYRHVGGLPYWGSVAHSGGRIHAATGYDKWGMTNAVAGAMQIDADIRGTALPWTAELRTRRARWSSATDAVSANAAVGANMIGAWLTAGVAARRDGRDRPRQAQAG